MSLKPTSSMDQIRLLCLVSIFYVASVNVGIGYAAKVDGGNKFLMSYWKSAFPKSPLPSKSVQQLLNLAGESSKTGFGKEALDLAPEIPINNYGSSKEETPSEPDLTTFFQGQDLQEKGKTVTLRLKKPTTNKAALLPRQVADSIPFSTTKLPRILSYFGVKPNSLAAHFIQQTLQECEAPAIKSEGKFCLTSLESLVDFTVSNFGNDVKVYTTEAETDVKQEYRIETGGVESLGDKIIVCHKENYVYGVFYCHVFYGRTTKAYMVPLVSADGAAKAKAVAVCHMDTASWNPKNVAFRVLNKQPGSDVHVCHFLGTTSLLWVPM